MCPPVDPRAGPEQSEAPHPLPCLWNVRSAHYSQFRDHSLERGVVGTTKMAHMTGPS